MSHFAILVIGDSVEEQLAPYQENNMGDCPKEYLVFDNTEDEHRKEFETGDCEMVRLEDGSLAYPWDNRFQVGDFLDTKKVIPPHLTVEKIRHKDRYSTFEEFMEDWCGVGERDPEMGVYGRWENPNAKWDWYTCGGRWDGWLKLKDNSSANSAQKGDVDWQGMKQELIDGELEKYHKFHEIVNGRIVPNWDQLREEYKDDINKAREIYHSDPVIKDLRNDRLFMFENLQYFQVGEEEFISPLSPSTFAVLCDGQWYERGSMGWWGCVSDEKDQGTWNKQFNELIEGLPDDTLLTVVDCHI